MLENLEHLNLDPPFLRNEDELPSKRKDKLRRHYEIASSTSRAHRYTSFIRSSSCPRLLSPVKGGSHFPDAPLSQPCSRSSFSSARPSNSALAYNDVRSLTRDEILSEFQAVLKQLSKALADLEAIARRRDGVRADNYIIKFEAQYADQMHKLERAATRLQKVACASATRDPAFQPYSEHRKVLDQVVHTLLPPVRPKLSSLSRKFPREQRHGHAEATHLDPSVHAELRSLIQGHLEKLDAQIGSSIRPVRLRQSTSTKRHNIGPLDVDAPQNQQLSEQASQAPTADSTLSVIGRNTALNTTPILPASLPTSPSGPSSPFTSAPRAPPLTCPPIFRRTPSVPEAREPPMPALRISVSHHTDLQSSNGPSTSPSQLSPTCIPNAAFPPTSPRRLRRLQVPPAARLSNAAAAITATSASNMLDMLSISKEGCGSTRRRGALPPMGLVAGEVVARPLRLHSRSREKAEAYR